MFDIEDSEGKNGFSNGAKIIVIGVGGGGCNAVNTMIREGLSGVTYIVANTDAQALNASLAEKKIQLGVEVTKGLGAGANPEIGKQAAMEDYESVADVIKGSDLVFITAGMGGGTGTGAAPVIAKLSRDLGCLTVGVVTKPFRFEGKKRKKQAEAGIAELETCVDSLITIPNEKLLELAGEDLTLVETFREADGVLLNAVRGISDLINNTGLINADFADVATVMANKGMALMGTGEAEGDQRAEKAAKEAINSPLLDDVSIQGATGIIVNISGGTSLTTSETNRAMNLIMEEADEDAEIIFGTVIDESLGNKVKVTVIATGLGGISFNAQKSDSTNFASRFLESRSTVQKMEEKPTPKSFKQELEPEMEKRASFAQVIASVTPVVSEVEESIAEKVEEPLEEERASFINEEEADEFLDENLGAFDIVEDDEPVESLKEEIIEETLEFKNDNFEYEIDEPEVEESQNDELHTSDEEHKTKEEARGFSRAKRIAQKLGFMNFDDDEFDKPAHEREHRKDSDH